MAWETRGGGRFYYRYRWNHGRVIKVYVGKGPAAERAAREDEAKRTNRIAQRQAAEIERVLERPARDLMAEVDGQVTVAIHSALMAAGYHRHSRGAWRKRRAKASEATRQTTSRTQGEDREVACGLH
jgi:hypothetical protein